MRIENELRVERAQILARFHRAIETTTRDPEVSPLATIDAHLQCALKHLQCALKMNRRSSGSSLNSQRKFAQVVFSKRLVRLARFFESKRFVHVDFERTRIDQGVESLDECRVIFSIVRFNGDTFRSSRLRRHAMWVRDAPAVANR